jgi:hypothetical protein
MPDLASALSRRHGDRARKGKPKVPAMGGGTHKTGTPGFRAEVTFLGVTCRKR